MSTGRTLHQSAKPKPKRLRFAPPALTAPDAKQPAYPGGLRDTQWVFRNQELLSITVRNEDGTLRFPDWKIVDQRSIEHRFQRKTAIFREAALGNCRKSEVSQEVGDDVVAHDVFEG
jgi:hypothetical protein